jgi:hypothetical protein
MTVPGEICEGLAVGAPIPGREFADAACVRDLGLIPNTFDVRFFKEELDGSEGSAFAWSFLEFDSATPGDWEAGEVIDAEASQYNACLSTFRASTFDNDLFDFDPLSGVLTIGTGGDARVAFYFLTARNACRKQSVDLYIDEGGGEELVWSGAIADFAVGKYLVFDLEGIPGTGATLRLETWGNLPVDPGSDCPSVPGATGGFNSHLSGIFVSGTDACAPQPDPICVPGTSIDKKTNGVDVLTAVPIGDPITWTYDVVNQNQIPLDFQIVDNQEGFVCSGTLAASGEIGDSTTCSLDGTALPGPYANTATLTLYLQGTEQQYDACSDLSGYTGVDAPGTGTPGYWKNHPEAWPVDGITIGGVFYTKAEAIDLMESPTKRDKTYNMFEQLVAAKLNVLIGNEDSCIADTIVAADAWMAVHPVGSWVLARSLAWREGEPLHINLDAYNNGELCAPHRD